LGSHILKLNTLKEAAERQDRVIIGINMGIGEIWQKIGLSPAKRAKKAGTEEIN
jgi:hypothetical protein